MASKSRDVALNAFGEFSFIMGQDNLSQKVERYLKRGLRPLVGVKVDESAMQGMYKRRVTELVDEYIDVQNNVDNYDTYSDADILNGVDNIVVTYVSSTAVMTVEMTLIVPEGSLSFSLELKA